MKTLHNTRRIFLYAECLSSVWETRPTWIKPALSYMAENPPESSERMIRRDLFHGRKDRGEMLEEKENVSKRCPYFNPS